MSYLVYILFPKTLMCKTQYTVGWVYRVTISENVFFTVSYVKAI